MNPLVQLILLSPLLVVSLGLLWIGLRGLGRYKGGRRLSGHVLAANLAGYAGFCALELLLEPTGTSYGQPQPVLIVFAAFYLFSASVGLVGLIILLKSQRVTRHLRLLGIGYYGLQGLALVGMVYAFYVEPLWIDVTYTTFREAKLPAGTPPIRIALISDIHMEYWTRREDEALKQLDALDPDLIIISGDFINVDHYEPASYADLHRFFLRLHARYGVYAAPGGVDVDGMTQEALADTNVNLLDDAHTTVTVQGQPLELVGVRTTYKPQDTELMQSMGANLPADHLKILIYHTPDLAPAAAEAGYDLCLSGHTHGGQIALPFYGAIFTASKYGRRYAAGPYNFGNPVQMHLYVTRGLGMEGMNTPRARLFARPEISVLTIVSSAT